jgi:hypothetical protein
MIANMNVNTANTCKSTANPFFLSRVSLKAILVIIATTLLTGIAQAATGKWSSKVTGGDISYKTTDAPAALKDASGSYMTVVYLENLNIRKIGQNTNASDVEWLLSQGYRVIELDYAGHSNAISTNINADIIAINDAIYAGSFCGTSNCSKYRSYVLFEGYRIARDVAYFLDDPTVYNYSTAYTSGDSLRMDIIYPANASEPVPVALSFSYSNSYFGAANMNQRLNLGNTLAGFNDSFLEGAPANGIAWAIADHPKYCTWGGGKPTGGANDTYKSYEVNPDAARKVKSAVRTLRAKGVNLGLSGKIGIYGFSRGSDAGSMAIGDRVVADFESTGLYTGTSDDVQVAALGSGVFDFTKIYNTTNDGDSNLETRCPWAWGALANNYALWETMGSAYMVQTAATAPVIFFYNTDDSHYYQEQIALFKEKLDQLGVATSVITNYGSGHSVPQTSASLNALYNFFIKYLTPPNVVTSRGDVLSDKVVQNRILDLVPDKSCSEIRLRYLASQAGEVEITVFSVSGSVVGQRPDAFASVGEHTETIQLNTFVPGAYFLKISAAGRDEVRKFMIR